MCRSLMWTVYGLAIGDVWVYGPNGTGLCLGLAQLALKILYVSVPYGREQQGLMTMSCKDSCSDGESMDGDPRRAVP